MRTGEDSLSQSSLILHRHPNHTSDSCCSATMLTMIICRSDVAVNIRGVKNAIYHGCTSFGDAMRIFKKHQDEGNVRATMPENAMPEPKQEHKDVPVFCSPSRSTSNTARRHHPTHASSDPDTPARGGSRQGTPARGRARAASSTPADDESSDDSPAPANTAPSTRNEARRAGSTTAHSRTGRTPAKDEPPPQRANPSEGTPTRLRNVHVENMTIKASNVSVRSRRHCYSTPSRAAPIRTPRRSSPPQSSSSEEEEDDDAGSVSPFQPPGSASSLGTEVEGESEPEVVSHISIAPSPRRTKQDSQNSAATRRYQPPPSTRQATQATDDSSKMKKTSADPTLPRAQTVKQTNDQQGEESTDDTDSTHLSRSSSPSTFETQYDDGDAPFGYQRRRKQQLRGVENNVKSPSYACGVPLTYPNDSISSALRSKRSPHSYPSMRTSCNTDEDEDDIVPTRPNTPPPSQTANSASQRRSHPAVISIEVCSGCSQVYPNPPLPPPTSTISRSRSGNSIGSSSSHRSIKICAGCACSSFDWWVAHEPPDSEVFYAA
ncbi:hypothetical protein BC835DRAFT_874317 [Cytidiella melzeri]|nr:hypothetical protein BC835DRAFT_874317 [Cytidiella melzeri]